MVSKMALEPLSLEAHPLRRLGRPWVPGAEPMRTMTRDLFAEIPPWRNMPKHNERCYTPGPPTFRECDCGGKRLTMRPFGDDSCAECWDRQLIAHKWRHLVGKKWVRFTTKAWERIITKKFLAKYEDDLDAETCQ